jgi:hypothetical protein
VRIEEGAGALGSHPDPHRGGEGQEVLQHAIQGDPADPLPRLGMGLAKIRDGDFEEGTREIETRP